MLLLGIYSTGLAFLLNALYLQSVHKFSHKYTDQNLPMIYYFLQSVVEVSISGCCSVPGLHHISCFQCRHLVTKVMKES